MPGMATTRTPPMSRPATVFSPEPKLRFAQCDLLASCARVVALAEELCASPAAVWPTCRLRAKPDLTLGKPFRCRSARTCLSPAEKRNKDSLWRRDHPNHKTPGRLSANKTPLAFALASAHNSAWGNAPNSAPTPHYHQNNDQCDQNDSSNQEIHCLVPPVLLGSEATLRRWDSSRVGLRLLAAAWFVNLLCGIWRRYRV